MLRYVLGLVAAAVVFTGCGTDDSTSTVTPSQANSSPGVSAAPLSPPAVSVTPSLPVAEPGQENVAPPEPAQVVPSAQPGESVELQFPPLSEQPAPGTDPGVPSDPNALEAITCETVCTSTGCEQYQYSVLGCP